MKKIILGLAILSSMSFAEIKVGDTISSEGTYGCSTPSKASSIYTAINNISTKNDRTSKLMAAARLDASIKANNCKQLTYGMDLKVEKVDYYGIYHLMLVSLPNKDYLWTYIKNKSNTVQEEEENLILVKKAAVKIKYIRNPSEQVKLAAVKANADAISYIKNPSEKLQLMAVKASGYFIKYIKNPTEQVKLAAVKSASGAIYEIKNPSEKLKLAAVKADGSALYYIDNPSNEVQLAAIKQDIKSFIYIDEPAKEVVKYYNLHK